MEKVRLWCGQPSDRGRLKNSTEQHDKSSPFNSTCYTHKMAIVSRVTVDYVTPVHRKNGADVGDGGGECAATAAGVRHARRRQLGVVAAAAGRLARAVSQRRPSGMRQQRRRRRPSW